MDMTETTGRDRRRIAGAVALLTSAIILAGCSAGSSDNRSSTPLHGVAPAGGRGAPGIGGNAAPEANGAAAAPGLDSARKAAPPDQAFAPEVDPMETPQSTFAVDVDTAS